MIERASRKLLFRVGMAAVVALDGGREPRVGVETVMEGISSGWGVGDAEGVDRSLGGSRGSDVSYTIPFWPLSSTGLSHPGVNGVDSLELRASDEKVGLQLRFRLCTRVTAATDVRSLSGGSLVARMGRRARSSGSHVGRGDKLFLRLRFGTGAEPVSLEEGESLSELSWPSAAYQASRRASVLRSFFIVSKLGRFLFFPITTF